MADQQTYEMVVTVVPLTEYGKFDNHSREY
jgi:hypothetical protein